LEVLRNAERNTKATLNGAKGKFTRPKECAKSALIEARCGGRALSWQSHQAHAPKQVVRTVPRTLNEGGLKVWPPRARVVITDSLEILLRPRMGLKPKFKKEVAALIKLTNCLCQRLVRRQVKRNRPLHETDLRREYLHLHVGLAKHRCGIP
jgi:hypothetical protein